LRLLGSIGDITCDELRGCTVGGQLASQRWWLRKELLEDVLGFLCLNRGCMVNLLDLKVVGM
jgi:hypothetical protein